jgi:hypothetical protein
MHRTFSITALVVSLLIPLVITAVLWFANRSGQRRPLWVAAGGLGGALLLLGVIDLARSSPRETPYTTAILGAALPVLGTAALLRATRRLHTWVRVSVAYVVCVVLFYGGLLLGATIVPRWFDF